MDYILVFLAGAVAFALFLKANPKIAAFFYKVVDKVEEKIEDKLDVDL